MTPAMTRPLLASLALTAVCAAGVVAQGLSGSLAAGANLETYTFEDAGVTGIEEVTLLTLPFGAALQPIRWAQLSVSGAFASGSATRADGSEASISGLTDTSVQLAVPVARDRFTLAAAVILPTGKSSYDQDEAQVAGIIAADLLPFRISNWGSGGALELGTVVATSAGGVNLGARVGYQMAREFDLLEEEDFAYRPGNRLYVRLGADGSIGDARLAGQAAMYRFADDQVNSRNLYRAGNRFEGLLSYTTPLGRRGSGSAYVGAHHRDSGVFLDLAGDTLAGLPGGPSETATQTVLLFGAGVRQPFRYGILVPAVDLRILRTGDGFGQGYVGGLGASLELPLAGGAAVLSPSARLRVGRVLVRSGVESGVTGFEVGAGLRLGEIRP